MPDYAYHDLFDLENRPGAGVRLWGSAVAAQFDRVVEANYRHRRNHEHGRSDESEDPDAETRLHTDVYFLALAIRRVLRFHEAIARQIDDARLHAAREEFLRRAAHASEFRDFYEHLDEYLLGKGRKQRKQAVRNRIAPVLRSRWDCDNLVVRFGAAEMDITLAAKAAIALSEATAAVWEEHLDRARGDSEVPEEDDGVPRMLEITKSLSTVIGGEDEGYQVSTGVLLDVRVREATPAEVATHDGGESRCG